MSTEPAAPPRKRRSPFLATGVTLAVAAGLGAYLYFVEAKREPGADKDAKEKEKVLTFSRAAVQQIRLQGAGAEPVTLVKDGAAWKLTTPQALPADNGEVDAVLGALEGVEIDEVVEGATALADFGLEPPAHAVTLTVTGTAKPLELQVGSRTPDGGSVYARRPSDARVFTLPSYVEGPLAKTAFDLRDRSLLHASREAIRRIEVAGPQAFTLEKVGETWTVTSPVRTLAGRWSVDTLVGNLEALRFEGVASETGGTDKAWGLDPAIWTVKIAVADGERTLQLGQRTPEGKVYAREGSSPRVVLLAPALADDLAKGLGELRMKRLHDVSAYEATVVEVADVAGARKLTRSTRVDAEGVPIYDWKRGDGKVVTTNTVQDALFLVGGVEATEFLDQPAALPAYGLDAPVLKVTIHYEAGKPDQVFEIGEKDGASWARRNDDAALLKLDPAKAKELKDAFAKL